MQNYTVKDIVSGLKSKQFSSVEITKHYLDRIDAIDPKINGFITVTKEQALKQAALADEKIASGNATTLTGVPIAHKDIFCTKGVKTTCGSKMLDNFISPYDATLIENFNNENAVMLGKTNMDEFAMGSANENSYYGAVKNPWDLQKTPGGSSGGSAAVVAANMAPASTGTDTGGSIRQPAAFCGLTGIKPTYGRVSRFGMVAFASSLDQAGPIAKTAEDTAILLNVMAGHDTKDSTSVAIEKTDYTKNLSNNIKGLKIGLPKQYFNQNLDSDIADKIEIAITELKKLGAEVKEINLPHADLAVAAYYVIAPAEASANLSRFDGVRYGYRCENPKDLKDLYKRSRGEAFGKEVKRRIMMGTYALSSGYYDAYYIKAQKIRRLISQDFQNALKDVDVILSPTAPTTAYDLATIKDPVSVYLQDIYTLAVNLAGLPAISMPAGFVNNLPVGMQIIGKHFGESEILNIAHQYQTVTDWHTKTSAI